MSSSLKGPTVLASFAVQPLASETESERYFGNHYNQKKKQKLFRIIDITHPKKRLKRRYISNYKKIIFTYKTMIRPVFGIDIGNFMELSKNLCFTGTIRGRSSKDRSLFFNTWDTQS